MSSDKPEQPVSAPQAASFALSTASVASGTDAAVPSSDDAVALHKAASFGLGSPPPVAAPKLTSAAPAPAAPEAPSGSGAAAFVLSPTASAPAPTTSGIVGEAAPHKASSFALLGSAPVAMDTAAPVPVALALSDSAALVPPDTDDDTSYSQDVAVMKRVRWFSQLPEFDDQYYRLLVDQQMFHDRDRRHNLGLHQRGVVVGLEVQYTGTGLNFTVTPGYAIDPDGFSLLRSPTSNVPPDRESSFTGSSIESGGTRYLCICPSLAKADEITAQGETDYSTWWDRPRIVLVSKQDLDWAQKADEQRRTQARLLKPSELGSNGTFQQNPGRTLAYNAVILAKVTRAPGSTLQFDYSERQCSGVIVPNSGGLAGDTPSPPAALCYQPDGSGSAGTNVFTGDLSINGKLTAAGGLDLGGSTIASTSISYSAGSVPGSAVDMSSAIKLPAAQLIGTVASAVTMSAGQLKGTLGGGVTVSAGQLTGTLAGAVVVPGGNVDYTGASKTIPGSALTAVAGEIIDWSAANQTIPNSALRDPATPTQPVQGQVQIAPAWVDASTDADSGIAAPIRLWKDPVSKQTYLSGALQSRDKLNTMFNKPVTVPAGFRPATSTALPPIPVFDKDLNLFLVMAQVTIDQNGVIQAIINPTQLDPTKAGQPIVRLYLSGVSWVSAS